MKIVVLGSTGMLGFAMHRILHDAGYDVTGTRRSPVVSPHPWARDLRYVVVRDFSNCGGWDSALLKLRPDLVVNAAGMVKQADGAKDLGNLVPINSVFPRQLAILAEAMQFRLLHFSTDCVFEGTDGMYSESDLPDASDAYGVSKFLGEVCGPAALTIRTSLIGRGLVANSSLVDWFLARTGDVPGFRKAIFTGLPVNEIARVTRDLLLPRISSLAGLYHLSSDPVDKFHLLEIVRQEWNRNDIRLQPSDRVVIDRSLDSSRLRLLTGYEPPPWPELIREMRQFYESLA